VSVDDSDRTVQGTVNGYTYRQVAKSIDHSLLKPELTEAQVEEGLQLAAQYDVAAVCCRPCDIPLAARLLSGTDVRVGSTVGFPHGANTTATKVAEALQAMESGAVELDMVLNIGQLLSGNIEFVRADIAGVVEVARGRALVKVILENAYLTEDQTVTASKTVAVAGGDFVKTSTGFAPTGAKISDLILMRASVPQNVQLKAAGGIRSLDSMLDVLDVGVSRVGATATKQILDEFKARVAGEPPPAPPAAASDDY
jgi:deoxyribose-phosphate aldolase